MVKSPETAKQSVRINFKRSTLCLVAAITAITVVSVGFAVPVEQSYAMMMRETPCDGCDPDSRLGSGVSSSHYGASGHTSYQVPYNQPTQGGTFTP